MIVVCTHCWRPAVLGVPCTCRRLSNLGEVVLTAAALDGRKAGPLDGDTMRAAARARREQPS